MSSSVFSETASARPSGANGDSNLVVVYSKNGISFDERAIENIMEEKSISSISVVRLTSPTPSMVEQEETERLEELERFLEANSDREDSDADRDTGNESQSGGEELVSEKDHVTGDDNENTGGENNDDSTETEAEAPKVKKRPGRKPKPKKQKKRRKPKERPQIVGLSVEQFYAENSADMVVKNALKLAGLSIFKRTPETDALMDIIRNDHNYTPFTSVEQMKAKKTAEKLAMERQTAQGRKLIVQTQHNIKFLNAKKRYQVVQLSQTQATSQQQVLRQPQQPSRQTQQPRPLQQTPRQPQQTPRQPQQALRLPLQVPRQAQQPPRLPQQPSRQPQQSPRQIQHLPRPQLIKQVQPPLTVKSQQSSAAGQRPVRNVINTVDDFIEDDDDANSSATAEEENGDTEELSEPSDDSRETDNDRDSDIDFKMNNSRTSNKRKRIKKLSKRPNTQPTRGQLVQAPKVSQPPASLQFPNLKRRKEQAQAQVDSNSVPAIGQIVQLNTKAPTSVIALGRSIPSTSFLKMRPAHKTLPKATAPPLTPEAPRMSMSSPVSKVRRTQIVGHVVSKTSGGFATPPQEVKEIIISKNLSSPKGVFTNLNSLLADNNNTTQLISSPDPSKSRLLATPNTPKSILNTLSTSLSLSSSPAAASKGFMPIGVETATSHKLPAQIVIETHQSSSELAAENDKQLDLIDSIVQDELLKASLVEQPPASADETIPKLVKMLESSAAGLDQVGGEANVDVVNVSQANNFNANIAARTDVDNIDIGSARLLDTPDEDEITADFLQHVVGLIEEDKQFEAEVVKQVLESATESGGLDAIASAVAPPIFETATQLTTLSQSQPSEFPAVIVSNSNLNNLPIACSTPARSAHSMSLLQNPEVKVVRGNGRVIYLPPMEAPTTRAKRRAQIPVTSTTTSDISNISHCEPTTLDNIQLANSSLDSDSFMSQVRGVHRKQLARESATSVRRPKRSNKLNTSQVNDADASESQEDDDDPNKLWCICRQPHNNRFMICCDLCEDWYHGTCVSVTKSMGLEMEQKGVDWKCPKCVKKQEEKSQPRITDMLIPKHGGSPAESATLPNQPNESKVTTEPQEQTPRRPPTFALAGNSVPPVNAKQPKRLLMNKPQPKVLHQQQLNFIKLGGSNVATASDVACVVCKRPARANSVYCSDECIRKYALSAIHSQTVVKTPEAMQQAVSQAPLANTLDAKKNKKKDLFEDVLRQADSVSKVERINVFERRSGKAITGHLAPSAQQLKKWLQDNPTYEVIPTGSLQAMEIERRQGKRISELSPVESAAAKSPLTVQTPKPADTLNKSIQLLSALPNSARKERLTTSQRRSPERNNSDRAVGKSQPEPVRLNVRRTLKEQLLARIKEAQAAALPTDSTEWLSVEEVDGFVKRVESEMYNSFGRDVTAKYKSKYRSLMFNIKDRKNKTLFEKICAKEVEPKQLVRMTPAELASQELAKWREEENRHQLDIIKKSELDLLSCAQNYLVKTHKGEEVIKTKVDVTLPEEEVEQSRSKEITDSSDSKKFSTDPSSGADTSSKELDLDNSTIKNKLAKKDKERTADRERGKEKEKERDKRHKSHKNHHQSGSKRSRSRSSSRGRSSEKRSHKRHHHDHDVDKEKDKQPVKVRADKDKVQQSSAGPSTPAVKKTESPLAFSLIDQILDSEKTVEQAANLNQRKTQPTTTVKKATVKTEARSSNLDKYGRYLQSLSSTAFWSGNLHMVDVTEFDVVIHPVQGDTSQLGKLLPTKLDVIGRITRDNVWDYIKKIKKSPTKEIIVVNLFPASASNTPKFDHFFEYLDTRQRLGVLGTDSEQIRDFYIFPLNTWDKLPGVLHTTENVPFYEDAQRPNSLLGIIVRCLSSKRLANIIQALPLPASATASNKTAKVTNKARARTTFTPPSSPKRKHSTHSTSSKDDEFDIDAIIKAPIAKLQKTKLSVDSRSSDDPNAPYSPGGSSDDNDEMPATARSNKNDLERKVDEINKQIAAQQIEIAGLLNVEPSALNQPTPSANALANISIPPDLTKILASLKEKTETIVKSTSGRKASNDEEYNPEDAIASNSSYGIEKRNSDSATRTKSRLAQLSEAELLSMVPDNLVDLPPATSIRHNEPPPPGV